MKDPRAFPDGEPDFMNEPPYRWVSQGDKFVPRYRWYRAAVVYIYQPHASQILDVWSQYW